MIWNRTAEEKRPDQMKAKPRLIKWNQSTIIWWWWKYGTGRRCKHRGPGESPRIGSRKGTSRPWNLWRPQGIVCLFGMMLRVPSACHFGRGLSSKIQSTFQPAPSSLQRECRVDERSQQLYLVCSRVLIQDGWLHQQSPPLTFSLGSMPIFFLSPHARMPLPFRLFTLLLPSLFTN
jgi:hypothetical protein